MTTNDRDQTFGEWLLAQREHIGWIGELVAAARQDRAFPKTGTPDDVRRHLNAAMADNAMFEAVDDAEADWRNA